MTAITKAQLDAASLDAESLALFTNGAADAEVLTRLGATYPTVKKLVSDIYTNAEYSTPIPYVSGISLTTPNQTVDYNDIVYAPIQSQLPFTTSGTFETAKFRVIQGLTANNGESLLIFTPNGTNATPRNLQSKLREFVSVKDNGAIVNGIADDTAAIAAARAVVEGSGGSVYYGGKTSASGFRENLAPLAQEWVRGSFAAFATDLSASKPLIGLKLFNGTPTVGEGFEAYGSKFDAYTKPGVDVSSTVAGSFNMHSYSTNSVGNNFNATNQVALVASAGAMDANASASVEAINAIAMSAYTGSLPHSVCGVEADVAVRRPAGWWGESNKTYSVGFSAVLSDVTTGHGTMAFAAGSNSGASTWLHGLVTAGTAYTGVSVARDGARRPQTGVWVSSAVNYGIYVGASPLYQLNPGSLGDYAYKPAVGIALGQEGATTANSHKLRFISTNGGVAANTDLYTDPSGGLYLDFNGTSKARIAAFDGSYWVQGAQVVGPRNTGWGTNLGVTSKAGFDSATVTLPVLAQTVSALQQAAKNHGLIGA